MVKSKKTYTLYSIHLIPILVLIGAFALSTAGSYGIMSGDNIGSILGKKTEKQDNPKKPDKAVKELNADKPEKSQESDNPTSGNANKNEQKSNAGGGAKVNRPDEIPNKVNSPSQKNEDAPKPNKPEKVTGKVDKVILNEVIKSELLSDNTEAAVLVEEVVDEIEDIEESEEVTEEVIDELENQPKWKTVLLGTNYKNLGQLRSSLVKTTNTIRKMNQAMEKVEGEDSKLMLQEQIKEMESEQTRLRTIIVDNEEQFSVLGWVSKLLTGYKNLEDDENIGGIEETTESTESTDSMN